MNESQVIWLKGKIWQIDNYVRQKGVMNMTDEDWQIIVAMADAAIAESGNNTLVKRNIMDTLELWESAYHHTNIMSKSA